MDPVLVREYEAKLGKWLSQGYQLLVDDIDGELRVTVVFVSPGDTAAKEREQEFWPQTPEIVELLDSNGIAINKALAGPRPWAGPHPEDR